MCLFISKINTREYYLKNKNKTKVIAWKVLRVKRTKRTKTYISLVRKTPYKKNTYIKAGCPKPTILCEGNEINGEGVHCYINRDIARKNSCGKYKVVKVIADMNDLMAVGINGDVCFTKVFFPNPDK